MSWVEDENATTSAAAPNSTSPPPGPIAAIALKPPQIRTCVSINQLRRRPSRPNNGASTRSMTGAHKGFSE